MGNDLLNMFCLLSVQSKAVMYNFESKNNYVKHIPLGTETSGVSFQILNLAQKLLSNLIGAVWIESPAPLLKTAHWLQHKKNSKRKWSQIHWVNREAAWTAETHFWWFEVNIQEFALITIEFSLFYMKARSLIFSMLLYTVLPVFTCKELCTIMGHIKIRACLWCCLVHIAHHTTKHMYTVCGSQ